jgi:hypothetical protein
MDISHQALTLTPAVGCLISALLYLPTLPRNPYSERGVQLAVDHDEIEVNQNADNNLSNAEDSYKEFGEGAIVDGYEIPGEESRFWKEVGRRSSVNIVWLMLTRGFIDRCSD